MKINFIKSFIFFLCFLSGSGFAFAQKIDFGLKIKAGWERTKYGGDKIIGSQSGKTYSFNDSAFRTLVGFGISVKRVLPKNLVLDADLTYEASTINKKFRFKEYPNAVLTYQATGIGMEAMLSRKFPVQKLPGFRFQIGAGIFTRILWKNSLVSSDKNQVPSADFKNSLVHDGVFVNGYYKIGLAISYTAKYDLLFGFSRSVTSAQNVVGRAELFLDLGFRINLGMTANLNNFKIYDPDK